jgi:O-antigen/teichoic acid export membrane protein
MVVGFIGAALGKVAENIMWGRGQFAATSLLQILDSVVRPPITIVMYYRFGLQGIVWGLVIAQVANALCSLYCVRDIFIGPLPRLYPVRKLIAESLPFYIDGYLWYLKGDGDTLLVSLLLGPAMLAEYYVAKTLYSNVMLVLTSLDKVALERLARYARLPELFREKAREMQLNISRSMIPLTLLVIAVTPYAMTVLAGPRYSGAKWPAIGLLVAALVQFLVITTDRAVFVALSGTWRLTKTAVEAACALSSALLLVPSLGLMGVIAARIFGPAMGGLFGTVVLNRKLRLSLPFGTAVLSFAVACPGTILILIFAPPLYGGVAALLGMVGSTIVWTAAFSLCTYVVDRDTFLNCMGLLRSRWRI